MTETALSHYYEAVDEDRIDDALDLLDPDVQFVMVLPPGRAGAAVAMRCGPTCRGEVSKTGHMWSCGSRATTTWNSSTAR